MWLMALRLALRSLRRNRMRSILTGWFDTFNRWAQDGLNSLGINWSSQV